MSDLIRSLQNKKATGSDAGLLRMFQEGAKGVIHDGGPRDRYVRGTPAGLDQREIGKPQAHIQTLFYENKKNPGPHIQKDLLYRPRPAQPYKPHYEPVQMDTERDAWEAYNDFVNPPEPLLPPAEQLNAPVVYNPYGRSWLADQRGR